jgi:hypothetical protein
MVDKRLTGQEERMTVANEADSFTIRIRKRPVWLWVLAGLWLLLEVLTLQTALASMEESEVRAATICWIAAIVLTAVGVLGWLHRWRSQKLGESSGQLDDASSLVEHQS